MKLSPAFLALLGLPDTATEDQALAAATTLKATAQATNAEQRPSLEQFVPRADYNALQERATNAEQALATHKKAEHDKEVDALLTAATQAGKITPATVDYHRAACQDESGLTRFKTFVEAAPVVGSPSNLGEQKPNHTHSTALNAEEQKVAALMGMSADEFTKGKA